LSKAISGCTGPIFTIFRQIEGICICVNVVNPDHFSDSSRYVAMATNFWQNWRNDLHSQPWHFKKDWNIAIWISSFIAAMILRHRVQIAWTLLQ